MIATLERTSFVTSRMLDFFSVKELTAQIGAESSLWPLAALKELVDNGLDAAESIGVPPEIEIRIDTTDEILEVADNGPGIPHETLMATLDFAQRVSTNSHYVSPTRGQQGNATKCVIAMPYVLDGEEGVVDVVAGGSSFRIRITTDEIAREPRIEVEETPNGKNGTTWRLRIPCYLLEECGAQFLPWLDAYSAVNPHATLRLAIDEELWEWSATDPSWSKWSPADPTPPQWYDVEDLSALIAAQVEDDVANGRSTSVRDWVRQFRGLKGTVKAKQVCEAADLSRATLSDLVTGGRIDRDLIHRLREAMCDAATAVKPSKLGAIGKARACDWCTVTAEGDPESFVYKSEAVEVDGVPYLIEAGFAHRPDHDSAQIVTGVNWSIPVEGSPFADSVLWQLGDLDVDVYEPVAFVLHVATPKPGWSDRGKGHMTTPTEVDEAITRCVEVVARKWHAHRERQRRSDARAVRQFRAERKNSISLKEAVFGVLEAAIEEMTGPRKIPFKSRNLYYCVRRRMEAAFGIPASKLTQSNFDKMLGIWEEEHGVIRGHHRDPRGYLVEPHSGTTIHLGTKEVEAYELPWWRYDTIVFVEKKGFQPALEHVRFAERFDVAMCYGEGYAVDACKSLLARAQQDRDITILCVHDADPAGKHIAQSLGTETLRSNRIRVVDVGLSLEEAIAMGLPSETFRRKNALPADLPLTETESEWWGGTVVGRGKKGKPIYECRRVELNAMHPEQFVDWLEGKLREHGCSASAPSPRVRWRSPSRRPRTSRRR